ncbi:hypothetical protein [Methylobacterium sp. E-045]|jgi:hypothetical protein|nr:hypothetical protein [Methylobacterium sp. E-045]
MVLILISLGTLAGLGVAATACVRAKQALVDTALDETRGYF